MLLAIVTTVLESPTLPRHTDRATPRREDPRSTRTSQPYRYSSELAFLSPICRYRYRFDASNTVVTICGSEIPRSFKMRGGKEDSVSALINQYFQDCLPYDKSMV